MGCIIMKNTKERRYKFMRLYNIYYICCVCKDEIDKSVKIHPLKNGSDRISEYRILGWDKCRNALDQLKNISCLRKSAEKLYYTLDSFDRDKEAPDISPHRKEQFENALSDLKVSLETIRNLYESLDIGKSKAGIDVKIPKCESLKDYTDYLKEIDFVFTQCPFLLCDNEQIKFNNVDVGSQWLNFILVTSGTFAILNNLGTIVNKVISIKERILLYNHAQKQAEEQEKATQMKNEVMEQTIDVFKQMKQQLLSDSVRELESEIGELKDGEERGKVEKTLEKMVVLIDKGVEIYSSIETPNEVKALFPTNEENPILPDNIVKLLEEKENKEE